jgi:hypothetical protein
MLDYARTLKMYWLCLEWSYWCLQLLDVFEPRWMIYLMMAGEVFTLDQYGIFFIEIKLDR